MAVYWPSSFVCVFMDRDEVESIKTQKKERGQYPAILIEQAKELGQYTAILTSRLVNNAYLLYIWQKGHTKYLLQRAGECLSS